MRQAKLKGRRQGLFEVRTSLRSKTEARLYFCEEGDTLVLLDGQIKKSRTADISLAKKRMKELKNERR
jgi:phage-related protein